MVFGLSMVGKMAAALFLGHWKTEFQNIWYPHVFGIQALTVLN